MLVVALAVAATGCSPAQPAASSAGTGKITVFAAAPLQKAFTQIAERFHAENPGGIVQFDFGLSPNLLARLTHGEAADLLAEGDSSYTDAAARSGLLADAPVTFATNTLVIVAAPDNPKKIASFRDLSRPGLRVAVCAAQPPGPVQHSAIGLPCGVALERIEQATGVRLTPVSVEPIASGVLEKMVDGDVDAAVVEASDVQAFAGRVSTVPFPEAADAVIKYPIAVLKGSRNPELARMFIGAVTGQSGQAILEADGFGITAAPPG